MTVSLPDLPPLLGEIFEKLSSGYHLCLEDGDIYLDLAENVEFYRALFQSLGFQLSGGDSGIFYFSPADEKLSDPDRRYTAFMAVMIDWLADEGRDPASELQESHFHLSDLPHLQIDQYRKLMEQIGVTQKKDLAKTLKRLQRLGFVDLVDNELFRFRKPMSRFLDLFATIAEQEKQTTETEGEKNG